MYSLATTAWRATNAQQTYQFSPLLVRAGPPGDRDRRRQGAVVDARESRGQVALVGGPRADVGGGRQRIERALGGEYRVGRSALIEAVVVP
ncbi:hypothetical protein ACFQHN_20470 [Natrialbaceae archaeon GCM10025896]